ncbi:MAG: SGNH/GDSL hydrolase family protein [Kiritimatiellae bacterium]|nr:SGNH/GDSL hydrolase family protein [Kiritimatiellia bacterium]
MREDALRLCAACVAVAAYAVCPSARGDVGAFDSPLDIPDAVVLNGVKWIDGRYLPIEGRAFDGTEHYYDRLPTNVTESVNSAVRTMKRHTAGMQFRFSTDSASLVFKWTPYNASLSADNMAATGASGIDVYRFDAESDSWRYVNTGRISSASGASLSLDWTPGTPCLVNLPLFNGISEFTLGIDPEASVYRLPPHRGGSVKPVVFYGSAVTQGLGASRPGMSFVNIVGRMLDVPVMNFGFSGGFLMEPEMSEHLAAIDASCYVLDGVRDVDATADCETFVRSLRAKRPGVPIVMAEKVPDDGEGAVDGDVADDCGMMALAEAYCRTLKRTLWPDLAWVDESADTVSLTGTWAPGIAYDTVTRKADLYGGRAFTPDAPSGGTPVTLEVAATFDVIPEEEEVPKAGAQGAVWIGTNGCFQAWTLGNVANVEMSPMSNTNFQSAYAKRMAAELEAGNNGTGNNGNTGNIPMWVDVVAEGVAPQIGVDYTFRFTFDYKKGTYGVEVKTGLTGFTRLRAKENPLDPVNSVQESFPLATAGSAVSEILFSGSGFLTSIVGEYVVVDGFAADDEVLLKDNAAVILDAAKAAWLNSCAGGRTSVSNAVSALSAEDFNRAYLLNLDITGETSYTFRITRIDAAPDKVTLGVTLTRTGKIAQRTNGVLKFYGAATVEAFTTARPIAATIPNGDFSAGDTATAEIPLGGETPPVLFKAKIGER